MIKANSIYIIASILCAVGIVSCLKSTESDDTQKPEIHDVRTNVNDTVLYNQRNDTIKVAGKEDVIITKYDTIRLNTQATGVDTLVLGHLLLLTARLTDDQAVSSYKIKINPAPSAISQKGDTVFILLKSWNVPTSNKTYPKEYNVKQNSLSIANDTITINGKKKPMQQGEHILTFHCTDVAGNNDSIQHNTMVLSRKSIIDSRISKKR